MTAGTSRPSCRSLRTAPALRCGGRRPSSEQLGTQRDGGDGGAETPPVWKRGRLTDADYPRELGEAGFQGIVSVKFLVWVDGRVRDCRVTKSSGNAILDATTCRLIRQRFRARPIRRMLS